MITDIGDIENFMDGFIDYVGGSRIDDELPKEVSFSNADYIVKFMNSIIELKTLEENQVNTHSFQDKLYNLQKPHFDNLVSEKARVISPQLKARQILNHYKTNKEKLAYNRIKKIINKANKQIKETKEYFKKENNIGTVWIVNENNLSLTVENQVNIISRILSSDDFSSVDAVVLSNLNMSIINKKEGIPFLYWVPIFRANRKIETCQSVHYLGHCWDKYTRKKFKLNDNIHSFKDYGSIEKLMTFINVRHDDA